MDPGAPPRWVWLRWTLPFVGACLLVGSFLFYEAYLEEALYNGSAPANNPVQWVLLAATAGLAALALLTAARIPLRTHLVKAVLLELAGAATVLVAWVVFITVFVSHAR